MTTGSARRLAASIAISSAGLSTSAHCALHPVDDANAVLAQWAAAAHQDAGLIGESGEGGSGFCRVGCGHHLRPQVSILNQRWAM